MGSAFGRGIDLPGETSGRIPDRAWKQQNWDDTKGDTCARAVTGYPDVARTDPTRAVYLKALAVENCQTGFQLRAGDAANFAIGQGDVAVTPLQMASAYAAIANGGTLWTPQVAAAFAKPDGTLVRTITPKARGQVGLSPGMLTFLHSALRGSRHRRDRQDGVCGLPAGELPGCGQDRDGGGVRQADHVVVRELRPGQQAEIRRRCRGFTGRHRRRDLSARRPPDLRGDPVAALSRPTRLSPGSQRPRRW